MSDRACKIIDSAAWTGRAEQEPPAEPIKPAAPPFQNTLARLAEEHGLAFASRVAASYNFTRADT